MQSRGIKGLLSSLRINYADYVGFPPELLALVSCISPSLQIITEMVVCNKYNTFKHHVYYTYLLTAVCK